jgi:hypothetical protein
MRMIDEEVETVLREIRERVRSMPPRAEKIAAPTPTQSNGDGALPNLVEDSHDVAVAETLARLEAYLMTTARSWDQLPPIVSNRSGATARLELWFKAKARVLMRWFTWEQVNFNAAVHHAIRDTLQSLSDHDTALRELRGQLAQQAALRQKEEEARQKENESRQQENEKQRKQNEAREKEVEALARDAEDLRIEIGNLRAEAQAVSAEIHLETESQRELINNQRGEINLLRAEVKGESETRRIQVEDQRAHWRAAKDAQAAEHAAQIAKLTAELRESVDQLQREQHVLFKQVSLETSEATAFQQTTRRRIDAALAELSERVEKLAQTLHNGK